jgi:hypothetical protein
LKTGLGTAPLIDRWAAAERTAAKAKPPIKRCVECGDEFTRLYRDIRPRLRQLREWKRSLYCSRQCCAAYRGGKLNAGWRSLPPYLAELEPDRGKRP